MRKALVGIAISLVTLVVMAELLAVAWYGLTRGRLFYTSEHTVQQEEALLEEAVDAASPWGVRHRLHPYFGFTKWTAPERRINNEGFPGNQHDFPFRKTSPRQYIVAVFGGSVATSFTNLGQERLIQRLQEHPALADREIVLLNMAQGGYKQPQSLLALSYYLAAGQEIDLVINLDGFNEVALSARNASMNIDAAMPSGDHLLPLADLVNQSVLTPERVAALHDIYTRQQRLARLAKGVAGARLASVAFVREQLYRIETARYRQAVMQFQESQQTPTNVSDRSLIFIAPSLTGADEDALFRRVADIWANSSAMMHALLAQRGIPYYHFLQPNQYVSAKPLSAEERRYAYSPEHPYAVGAVKGYPYLLARAEDLRRQGVRFVNAVDAFDAHPETLYIDDCCHFNRRGAEILADLVADAILASPPFAGAGEDLGALPGPAHNGGRP
ncbi:MAG: hypothetical protein NZ528_15130 [Caldilineales bacterium]|nr:hypothetical protein [Caldilineales bacterium]MDW8319281.1 hypothetical protein [Anaerolineae bacterium]